MTRGVLYIATGERYVRDAIRSAESLSTTNDIPAALIAPPAALDEVESHPFDTHVAVPDDDGDIRYKSANLEHSPYEKTLLLDADTRVLGDLSPVLDLLDTFDVAARIAPHRRVKTVEDVSPAFPEVNAGVVAFNLTDRFEAFLDDWRRFHQRQQTEGLRSSETMRWRDATSMAEIPDGRNHEQPTFREALYHSDLRLAPLPAEYNFPCGKAAYVQEDVKIIHPYSEEREALATTVNETSIPRAYLGWNEALYRADGRVTRYWDRKRRVLIGLKRRLVGLRERIRGNR